MLVQWLVSALLIGFVGSVHCIGMCGGMSSLLVIGQEKALPRPTQLLLFNLGRVTTYSILGLLFGILGAVVFLQTKASTSMRFSAWVMGIMLVLIGLYVAQWFKGIVVLEKPGFYLYQKIQPLVSRLLPIQSSLEIFLLGMSWGLLPCGLVYSALVMAFSSSFSNTPGFAAAYMASFGLGTLPAMLVTPYVFAKLKQRLANPLLRGVLGFGFIVWGMSIIVLMGGGHAHVHHH